MSRPQVDGELFDNELSRIERALDASERERATARSVPVGSFSDPGACVRVLEDTARELAMFEHEWANAAGALEDAERALADADAYALIHLDHAERAFEREFGESPRTASKEDREALARWYADQSYPGLRRTVARLRGAVERAKARYKALDRIANSAQSALASHRESMSREEFIV